MLKKASSVRNREVSSFQGFLKSIDTFSYTSLRREDNLKDKIPAPYVSTIWRFHCIYKCVVIWFARCPGEPSQSAGWHV